MSGRPPKFYRRHPKCYECGQRWEVMWFTHAEILAMRRDGKEWYCPDCYCGDDDEQPTVDE